MTSGFLTSIKRLRVSDSIPNQQLFQDLDWPLDEN